MRRLVRFDDGRRRFVAGAAWLAASLAAPAFAAERTRRTEEGRSAQQRARQPVSTQQKPAARPVQKPAPQPQKAESVPVTPPEDLMREHGVLRRVLLIYATVGDRLQAGREVAPETLANAAGIVRRFVEDYHESLEEDHVFPRFRTADRMDDLVAILTLQHQKGRGLTDGILADANVETLASAEGRMRVVERVNAFIRMYRPHASREDTALFPALRSVTTPQEFQQMSERFEAKETELFGQNGFLQVVGEVSALEQGLGIYDLAQFTP